MCGIAGAYLFGGVTAIRYSDSIARMTRSLSHRGPDGEHFAFDGPVGLGHRRLAIVDLTDTGTQPMWTLDGDAVISYNGEFYNHLDFRKRLESRGVRFRGTSDTETLLYLLVEYGPDVLNEVSGIFSVALWNRRQRRLILARDPIGVKQLYFHEDANRVVFASEIKSLFCFPGVAAEMDPEGVNQYLHFHTPLFERTFFKGIRQLQAAENMEVSERGTRRKRYWQLDGFDSAFEKPADAVEELALTLSKVVQDQLMSDVPVGSFFSGGIDSTAVASFATRSGKAVRCFGVHFSEHGVVDELPYQRAAAAALGVDLEVITVDRNALRENLETLLYFQDQPLIGAAMIPMYFVSRLAARHVKVCLGGQAADEIFGGYARYGFAEPWRVVSRWMRGRASVGGDPGNRPWGASSDPLSTGSRVGGNLVRQIMVPQNLRRLAHSVLASRNWAGRYFENFVGVPAYVWEQVFSSRGVFSRERAWEIFEAGVDASPAKDPATRLMHWDVRTYLPGLLSQDDRMSMANSLESRVPFADPRIMKLAFHIPFAWKFRAGASKWILRQAVAGVVPSFVLNRRKVGFDTPAEQWLRNDHDAWVRDVLIGDRSRSRGLFETAGVRTVLDARDSPFWFQVVWKLLCIELWARQFLDGDGLRSDVHTGIRGSVHAA
jgi:asparagine synthase (glutamine-hydrolysing)